MMQVRWDDPCGRPVWAGDPAGEHHGGQEYQAARGRGQSQAYSLPQGETTSVARHDNWYTVYYIAIMS